MSRRKSDLEKIFGPYTHLLPEEVAIWERWLGGEGVTFHPYEYDIRVGHGLALPPDADDLTISIRDALTRKRIDAVSIQGPVVNIFEVKRRAGLGSIGQLIGYEQLYRDTKPYRGKLQLWLITDRLQPDMMSVLAANDINWREV